jgi:DNA-binding MarR family transcriptional regulator
MYKDLDPLLHQQLRLSVMSILIGVKDAEFNYIKEKTKATAGNLSVQLNKLLEAGYITINKSFRDNYPLTTCAVTKQGVKAFDEYVKALKVYLNPSGDK